MRKGQSLSYTGIGKLDSYILKNKTRLLSYNTQKLIKDELKT